MGLLSRLFKRKKREEPKAEETIEEPTSEIIEENVLNLGWYWSENKNEFQMAKIKEGDRQTHLYIVGASGAGKSKFLEFLIRQDIQKGNGFGIIDPHGDLIEDVKGYLALALPKEKLEERVVLIDPTDEEYTVAFNPLEKLGDISSAEIAANLLRPSRRFG